MIGNQFNFFVVEDEPANRQGMIQLLSQATGVQVVGEAESVDAAFDGILQTRPTALMLDIKLIGGDAFMLMQRLRDIQFPIPPTVIVTGYLEFELAQETLNRFRDHVVYIMQKPILEDWQEKFASIQDAIRTYHYKKEVRQQPSDRDRVFMLRAGPNTHRVKLSEIEYIEVGGGGTIIIHTDFGKEVRTYKALEQMLQEAGPDLVRIHRSIAVHRNKISHIDHEDRMVYLNGMREGLGIGDVYYGDVLEMMKG